MKKLRLLVVSHVIPVEPKSGQQQRVKNKLLSLKGRFDVTFATTAEFDQHEYIKKEMSAFCDEIICLEPIYNKNTLNKMWYSGAGYVKSLSSSLKKSNYIIGEVEFSPDRIRQVLSQKKFDCVLFEYWHAYKSVEAAHQRGIPCVLDMHNVLWQSHILSINSKSRSPDWWKERRINGYRETEIQAWNEFDGIITINKEEHTYVKDNVRESIKLFYAPMGIDLSVWNYSWKPESPPRVGYYGGLASSHNQQSALDCYEKIMPAVWQTIPEAELWIIGSDPPQKIRQLAQKDPRVKVTGFVEDIKSVMRTLSVVVCPWKGLYGFRSRLVEVMALGIPLVTTSDAVYGMEMENGRGVSLADTFTGMSKKTIQLLTDSKYSLEHSRLARDEIKKLYSVDNTYQKLTEELHSWIKSRNSVQ